MPDSRFDKAARVEMLWYNLFNREALWIFQILWTASFPLLRTI
jgi:hypothetical protein